MQMFNKARREIAEIINKNRIDLTWIAKESGIDYDVLWRQLNIAKHYREEVHDAITKFLKKHGYITSEEDQINIIKDEIIDSGAIINGALSLMSRSFKKMIEDKRFDDQEKKQFKDEIKNLQNRINDALDSILITINMK